MLSVLTFLVFDSLYYVGSTYSVESRLWPFLEWLTAAALRRGCCWSRSAAAATAKAGHC